MKKKLLARVRRILVGPTSAHREMIYLGDHRALTRTVFGHKMYVDSRDIGITPHLLFDGVWERHVTNFILSKLSPGMNVIEVGANVGYYSLLIASKIIPTGRIYAFEANEDNFLLLHDNLHVNGFSRNAELVNSVVCERTKEVSFTKLVRFNGSGSIHEGIKDYPHAGDYTTVMAKGTSLDEYFRGREQKIDLIKIDAEGSEPLIYTGMQSLLKNNPNIAIIMEWNLAMLREVMAPSAFLDLIMGDGFDVQMIDNGVARKTDISELLKMDQTTCDLWLTRQRV
jgi:FkbM family methyltransferase